MKLDRFTQKAQEAIVAAQRPPENLDSPILDAEHLLAALVEPDDGVPAETLRRLGVDLPALPRRARRRRSPAAPGSRAARCRSDPRADAGHRARPRPRPGASGDEYVSTEHLLLGVAEVGGEAQQLLERHGAGREAILQALQSVRGGQRVTSPEPRGAPTRRSRSTAAT